MTEMKNARWERMVAKVQIVSARDGMGPVVLRSTAVMLLARQHAAMMRLVRKAYTYGPKYKGGIRPGVVMVPREDGEWINVNDLLAALAKQGGEK